MKVLSPLICLLAGLMLATSTSALEPRTPHTFQLAEGEQPPDVSLDQVAWLAGSWEGEAFGSRFEEVWNPPSAGSMVGFFKLMKDDEVSFYELMTLTRDDGRLSLKVKHFNADFTAWEDKADFVNFKLVGIEENAVHFSGISFYRESADRIIAYIVMKTRDGIREEKLTYSRRQ